MIRYSSNVTGNFHLLQQFGTKFDGAVNLYMTFTK